jgi:hypothetical protein
MRYTYSTIGGASAQAPVRTAVTETFDTHESTVEVVVSAVTYDRLLAIFAESGSLLPADIAAVFQHRAPFTVICDPTVA